MKMKHEPDHWLVYPRTIRRLRVGFAVVLALSLLAQAVVPIKSYARIDAWPGFAAAYGMLSCVLMVVVAKALGAWLKRKDDYYDA
jgi:hypothetical protein